MDDQACPLHGLLRLVGSCTAVCDCPSMAADDIVPLEEASNPMAPKLGHPLNDMSLKQLLVSLLFRGLGPASLTVELC